VPRRFCVHITSRKIPFTKNYNNHEMTLAASVTGESDTVCHVRTKTAAKKKHRHASNLNIYTVHRIKEKYNIETTRSRFKVQRYIQQLNAGAQRDNR